MKQAKTGKVKNWSKHLAKMMLWVCGSLLAIFFVSALVMQNTALVGISFRDWFYETRLGWFSWRLFLYVIILALLYLVTRHLVLSFKAKLLIISSIIVIEGLNLFYLFG